MTYLAVVVCWLSPLIPSILLVRVLSIPSHQRVFGSDLGLVWKCPKNWQYDELDPDFFLFCSFAVRHEHYHPDTELPPPPTSSHRAVNCGTHCLGLPCLARPPWDVGFRAASLLLVACGASFAVKAADIRHHPPPLPSASPAQTPFQTFQEKMWVDII